MNSDASGPYQVDSTAPAAPYQVDSTAPAAPYQVDSTTSAGHPGVAVALLGTVALLMTVDLVTDAAGLGGSLHVAVELAVAALAGGGAVYLWRAMVRARRQADELGRQLAGAHTDAERQRADAVRWRREAEAALRGLGAAIDAQFERWQLTAAEREVALLLLKGLSLKEAADVRATSERTVRQQALAVYRKAGLSGRAELSAFFLEDLLLPSPSASRRP